MEPGDDPLVNLRGEDLPYIKRHIIMQAMHWSPEQYDRTNERDIEIEWALLCTEAKARKQKETKTDG